MLTLITMFLITPIIVATAIWLYRLVSNWRGAKYVAIGRKNTNTPITLTTQQGFVSLTSVFRGGAKHKGLHGPKGSLKTPWGW